MAHRDVWPDLALTGADVALLQEVPPPHALSSTEIIPGGEADWRTAGWEKCDWRTAIARLSEVVHLAPLRALRSLSRVRARRSVRLRAVRDLRVQSLQHGLLIYRHIPIAAKLVPAR